MFERQTRYSHERTRGHGAFSGQTGLHFKTKDCRNERFTQDKEIVEENAYRLQVLIDVAPDLTDRGQYGRYHSFTADLYVDHGNGAIRDIDYANNVDPDLAAAPDTARLTVEVMAATVDFRSRPGLCPHQLNLLGPESDTITDLEAHVSRRALHNLVQSLQRYNEQ